MRGQVDSQADMFHMFDLEEMVPANHPLRAIKPRVDRILAGMSPLFDAAYGRVGRPGIPVERLIKALLLQKLYSIRSEIQLCQQIGFNMLYRWFLDMNPSETAWTPEVFSMNRKRFEEHGFVQRFFDAVTADAIVEGLVSSDHFTVDGTLIQSFASMKSLRPIGSEDQKVSDHSDDDDPHNPTINFRDEKRRNVTHRSLTDPEARLARKGKGKPAYLSHSGHVLMENRNGLCLDISIAEATGTAEREQALSLLSRVKDIHGLQPSTLGMDAGYADGYFMAGLESDGVVPHVPVRKDRPIKGNDDGARARRRAAKRMKGEPYQISQRIRKKVEEIFGWMKTVGDMARAKFVGRWKIQQQALVTGAAYNLLRMARLRPIS